MFLKLHTNTQTHKQTDRQTDKQTDRRNKVLRTPHCGGVRGEDKDHTISISITITGISQAP